jgi:PleD family two-component response regulator
MAQRKKAAAFPVRNGLRVLILEDVPTDAKLIERELRGTGVAFQTARVDGRDQFLGALQNFSPDFILADYSLQGFDGAAALSLARENAPDTPFIFVTGTRSVLAFDGPFWRVWLWGDDDAILLPIPPILIRQKFML